MIIQKYLTTSLHPQCAVADDGIVYNVSMRYTIVVERALHFFVVACVVVSHTHRSSVVVFTYFSSSLYTNVVLICLLRPIPPFPVVFSAFTIVLS